MTNSGSLLAEGKLGRTSKAEKQRLFALFGNPVGHSLSPLMHNAAYEALNLSAQYIALAVPDGETALHRMREMGIEGASVTLPLKTAIMACLDEIDDHSRAIGAVNTLWAKEGRVFGGNTDWVGFTRSLKDHFDPRGKTFAILGSGGAARAAVFAIRQEGGNPIVFSRNPESGTALAREFHCPSLSLSDLERVEAHCLVNTTPVGMSPNEAGIPVHRRILSRFAWVMDLVYTPLRTRLLKEAEAEGCGVITGLPMLVHQGAEQIRVWTGKEPPVDLMHRVAEKELLRRSACGSDS
jgi:shikimate dehydrogenase